MKKLIVASVIIALGASLIAGPAAWGATALGAPIPVGHRSTALKFSPNGKIAYVANYADNTVSSINVTSGRANPPIPVGVGPFSIAFAPNSASAYVVNRDDNSVSVIDVDRAIATSTIKVGREPISIALTKDGATAYVSNFSDDTISVIDLATGVTRSLISQKSPGIITVSPDNKFLYIATNYLSEITVIDTKSNMSVKTISLYVPTTSIALSPDGTVLYATNERLNSITIVDVTKSVIRSTVQLDSYAYAIDFSRDGKTAYIAGDFPDLAVVNVASSKLETPIRSGTPWSNLITVSPNGVMAYVVSGTEVNVVSFTDDPHFTAISPPSGTVGTAYSYQITTSGSSPSIFSAPFMPAGLTLTPQGLISGIPSPYLGDTTFRVTATNRAGTVYSPRITISITDPIPPPSAAVYRFWSKINGAHFYTISTTERDEVIARYPGAWAYEGAVYDAFTTQVVGTIPLYRFWSNSLGSHFYTADPKEKVQVIATWPDVWQYEQVAYYVYPLETTIPHTTPVYRFWSPRFRKHFYTASQSECDSVVAIWYKVWSLEGARFKVPATNGAP
ncbi:MAG: beta-propeller fold lactonase family protein [Microbacteriaceae bacterium]|nr:beta-propeller fold lactonase family protein [Microbacteriaceae bacterium]